MELGEAGEVAALNARIRRVLSVLRTIADHMGVRRGDPAGSALELGGRIGALARAALMPVFFDGMDLESLIRDELLLCAAPAARFSVSGTGVRLNPALTEWMSLLIHELATNAVKYGALSQSHAKIEVAWGTATRHGAPVLQLEWLESGVSMAADPPSEPGFGSILVERLLARHLKGEGTMTFLPDGVRCKIAVPLMAATD